MSNHFHVLVEVPQRPAQAPDDEALLKLLAAVYRGCGGAGAIRQHLGNLRKAGADAEAEAYRETFFARMWDVSAVMKLLKLGHALPAATGPPRGRGELQRSSCSEWLHVGIRGRTTSPTTRPAPSRWRFGGGLR